MHGHPLYRPLWWLAVAVTATLGVLLAVWLRDEAGIPEPRMGDGANETRSEAEVDPVAVETRVGASPPGDGFAWSVAESAQVEPDWVPSQGTEVAGAVFVALGEAMAAWRQGDTVQIAIPQLDATYPAVIERVDSALAGNRSYIGKVEVGARDFSFVITVGARNVFGYVGTPDGSYELVANRRFGWLMPTANMDQHVDYSKPDYLLPGETRPGVR